MELTKKRDIEIKNDVFKKGYKDYFHKDSIENLNSERYLEYLAYSDYINFFAGSLLS